MHDNLPYHAENNEVNMKVNKLIEKLKTLPNQEAEVLIPDENGGTVEVVGFAENRDHSDIIICDKDMIDAFREGLDL